VRGRSYRKEGVPTDLDELGKVHQEALWVINVLENLHSADNIELALALLLEKIFGRLMAVLEAGVLLVRLRWR
jgi:hypothetical protein